MILIFIIVPVVLIAFVILALLFRWLWKKGPYSRCAAIGLFGYLAYSVLTAIFPLRSFYEEEFAYRTGLAMPPSAKILFKYATYPDYHGDYSCEVLFEVSKEDFAWLERVAKSDPFRGECSGAGMFQREAEARYGRPMRPIIHASIRQRDSGQVGSWMLLDDRKTVYFWFVQT